MHLKKRTGHFCTACRAQKSENFPLKQITGSFNDPRQITDLGHANRADSHSLPVLKGKEEMIGKNAHKYFCYFIGLDFALSNKTNSFRQLNLGHLNIFNM